MMPFFRNFFRRFKGKAGKPKPAALTETRLGEKKLPLSSLKLQELIA